MFHILKIGIKAKVPEKKKGQVNHKLCFYFI